MKGIEYLPTLIQIVVLIIVIAGALRMILHDEKNIKAIFFVFAIVAILLSDIYWLAYDLLRPFSRMPFAANEIAEWASFISLGAVLASDIKAFGVDARKERIFSILFVMANVALWIAWTGEWLQDIMTGFALGYLLFYLMIHLKQSESLSKTEWRILAVVCIALIAANTMTFFVDQSLASTFDQITGMILFAGEIYFITDVLLEFRKGTNPAARISLAFALFAWSITSMYMSADIFYFVSMIVSSLSIYMMFVSLKMEVEG
ncbi:MAG: hypothetical protein J6W58_07150 [Lachnospiraceae bacterium]|nr:hypothetical protein [Lachnospiraceae bacterium]MBP5413821.1 hypothetical protein [Lachnospiraceae bacterium]MBP5746062.1 hypothetical protein [Lachnospiraceae bacterium]